MATWGLTWVALALIASDHVGAAPPDRIPARPAQGGGFAPPPPPGPGGTTYVQPAQPYVQPAQPYVQPGTTYVQPAQPYVQPGTTYVQPAQPYVQPAQPYVQPGYVQPGYVQPGRPFPQQGPPVQQPLLPAQPPQPFVAPGARPAPPGATEILIEDEEPIEAGEEIAPDDPSGRRPIIQRIEFSGNLLYSAGSMETRMRNKVGRPLDRVALEADVAELRKFFNDIQVLKLDVPGGILLRFLVSENPLIVKLTILGADEIEDDEIRGLLRSKEGYPLSDDHLAQDREDIVAAYKLRGYHFADVPEPRVTELATGGLQVDLIVVEGPKVEVSNVLFRGRRSLPREDLLEVLQTRSPTFFEGVFGAPLFREETMREDLVAIKQLYRSNGMLDAEAVLDDLRFSDDKSKVEITIALEEGLPYQVGTINVVFGRNTDTGFQEGRLPADTIGAPRPEDVAYFTTARVREMLGLRTGMRYSGKVIEEGRKKLKEKYFERSFHDIVIQGPTWKPRQTGRVVDLDVRIAEGPKFRLSRIDFVGNDATKDFILRRDVRTAPGGFVDRNELDRGTARLNRLGYFDRATLRLEDAVGPDGQALEGWKTATYEVVERSTRTINLGASVDTNGGVGVFIEFNERNFDISRPPTSWHDVTSGRAFKGGGQDLRIRLQPNTRVTQFDIGFREPRLFGSKVGFSASLFSTFEFRERYRADRKGYSLGLSYPLYQTNDDSIRVEAGLRWKHELVDINSVDDDAVPGAFLFAGEQEIRRIEASLGMATLDNLRDPRWETTTRLSFEYGGDALGGDLDFVRFVASHDQLIVLHKTPEGGKHRVLLNGSFGYAEALADTPELPPYERFYLGGRTLRGFDFRGVGPHVNGVPTGGEFMWSGSATYEYPLLPKSLSLAAFIDAGTVAETIHSDDATSIRVTLGAGLRLVLPFLSQQPIALDFGFVVLDEDEDQRSVFSFSFSRNF